MSDNKGVHFAGGIYFAAQVKSYEETLREENAALRLAATELYEFILEAAPHCGIDPDYGPLGRMAQVLGVKK